MAGSVVLGIFAMVYVQSAQNRANFSQITTLMSFREQVMTYYSSVVANRATWECTVRANGLAGVLTSEMSHTRLEERKGRNAPDGYLSIRDYSGNCLTTSGGVLLIAQYNKGPPISGGLGLNLQDYNDLPIAQRDCDNSEGGTHFCLRVEWEDLRPDWGTSVVHGVEVKLVLTANRKAIKKDLDVNFELKDKEHHLFMRRTVSQDCGNHAITSVDALSGGVACDVSKLVIPIKGSCPRTSGGGTTAIAYFDRQTGLTKCSGPNILVEKVDASDIAKHCRDDNRFGVVRINNTGVFQCSTHYVPPGPPGSPVWGTTRGGVDPAGCSGNEAIRGFHASGAARCVQRDTEMPGFSGPQGERGDSGREVYNRHNTTGRVYMGRDRRGNSIYRYGVPSGPAPSWWPSGRPLDWRSGGGVGWRRGPRGAEPQCDTRSRAYGRLGTCRRSYTPCS